MSDEFILNRAFCCPSLQNSIANAGERGFAILVSKDADGIIFVQEMRAITFADEAVYPRTPMPDSPIKYMTLSGSMRINYCSTCGRRLQDLVKASPKFFEGLAEKHKQFYKSLF